MSRLVATTPRSVVDAASRVRPPALGGSCPFCPENAKHRYERVLGTVAALRDGYPVAEGHFIVVPLRHTESFLTMTPEERRHTNELLAALADEIAGSDEAVQGFNIGMNCGEVAGQTVPHAHAHLIPRRRGDTPHPRGGVRGVIPAKMDY